MAEKYEERVEVKGTNRCPIFSGMEEDYETWRILASDWMEIEGNKREYPGLEMRAAMRGKALDVVVGIPQVDLKGDEGTVRLIKELEKYYQKESRTYKLMKLKELMNIKRGTDESMEEYIRRYEKVARDLKSAGGGELEENMKGWHLLGQAGLEDLEEQVVVGACHTQEGYDHIKGELMRIFGGKGKKDTKAWLEKGRHIETGGKDKTERKEGNCFKCGEKGHWARGCKKTIEKNRQWLRCYVCWEQGHLARDCRMGRSVGRCWKCGVEGHKEKECKMDREGKGNLNNRGGEQEGRNDGRIESVMLGEERGREEWEQARIEAILDTGCRGNLCGLK